MLKMGGTAALMMAAFILDQSAYAQARQSGLSPIPAADATRAIAACTRAKQELLAKDDFERLTGISAATWANREDGFFRDRKDAVTEGAAQWYERKSESEKQIAMTGSRVNYRILYISCLLSARGAQIREQIATAKAAELRNTSSTPSAYGQAPSSQAAQPVNSLAPSRQRLLHNPAASAMSCAFLREEPSGKLYIVNDCGVAIEAFWCSVSTGECERDSPNTWTIGAGKNWPLRAGEYRWAACRGANSGKFENGSQGTRFVCPSLDPPK